MRVHQLPYLLFRVVRLSETNVAKWLISTNSGWTGGTGLSCTEKEYVFLRGIYKARC